MKLTVIISAILILSACRGEQHTADHTPATHVTASSEVATPETASSVQPAREQTIEVAAEFTPASVTIPANTPVRLHFRRGDKPSCADEVVFPDLKLRKKLPANQTVTFDIPPQQARTLSFACGMDMMKGTAVVQ